MTSKLNNLDFIFSYYERKNKRSECDITPVEMSTECLEIFKHDSFSKILFNFSIISVMMSLTFHFFTHRHRA